jgi:hypothetical protein
MVAGCSGGGKTVGASVSTLHLHAGQCIVPPTQVKAELATISVVPCRSPHTQEVFDLATYNLGPTDVNATFPGADKLKTFAQGACLQAFPSYVGTAYPDSALFVTYLLPSPRSWTDGGDRSVACIASTTGQQLRASVKGSKL